MDNILIIGAGRSATALIKYILKEAAAHQWNVMVADANIALAEEKTANCDLAKAVALDVLDVEHRQELVQQVDVVVSLLPPYLHIEVARDCVTFKKHLMTASYITKEMDELSDEARKLGLIFMGEIGLDPGLDHMSAMQIIDKIKAQGGELITFQSYTGGLIAPESDDNPWHYKFTWNPRNVVMAGQGTAQYLEDGKVKYIPYNRLFKTYKKTEIEGMGTYEVYANRDSLSYREIYGIDEIPNIYRGTIRCDGFCDAWDAFVKLGITDDSYNVIGSDTMTYRSFTEAFVPKGTGSLERRLASLLGIELDAAVMKKLDWAGILSDEKITVVDGTPAQILENLLLTKWTLRPTDRDMIIMKHEFEYSLNGEIERLTSTLVMEGEDQVNTAMAKLVGLPLGIFVKLVMEEKITSTPRCIPVMKEVYEPVLAALKEYGVEFVERELTKAKVV